MVNVEKEESEMGPEGGWVPGDVLRAVVVIVAHNKGMVHGEGSEGWVDVVLGKMQDVGRFTLRVFVGSVLRLNIDLEQVGYHR
jgi:hypothetical protein